MINWTPGSQLYQDVFALKTSKNKSYIEIGAAGPVKYNNTYKLEKTGWNGFSIELNPSRVSQWFEDFSDRKNKIYCADAITFDYLKGIQENNLPNRIGYLSCDIEPPENTFAALKKVIEQGIIFDCITFEHDKYQSEIDYDPIVTEYLKNKGYKVAVKDVYRWRKRPCYMETWFVNADIEYVEKSWDEWRTENI
jgi:hypothetical protein